MILSSTYSKPHPPDLARDAEFASFQTAAYYVRVSRTRMVGGTLHALASKYRAHLNSLQRLEDGDQYQWRLLHPKPAWGREIFESMD
jgi:hypothetical protein